MWIIDESGVIYRCGKGSCRVFIVTQPEMGYRDGLNDLSSRILWIKCKTARSFHFHLHNYDRSTRLSRTFICTQVGRK